MIRDITIGQYYPAKSVIHRLDPRVKLMSTFLYLISLFLFKSISGYLIATVFLAVVIKVSRVPFSFIVRGLKPVIMLLLITVLFNLFLTRSGEVLFHAWIFTITEGGLVTAVYMAVRLIYLIIGSSLMTFTTTPNELTDGIEALLYPLNKVRVIPILVPLFVSAFRRANDLAMAMEARCYRGGEGRTKMKPLCYRSRDYMAYLVMIVYVVTVVVIGRFVPLHVWIF